VFGDIAQHSCGYAKEGVRDGTAFTGRGHKTFDHVNGEQPKRARRRRPAQGRTHPGRIPLS
jgi:hypothetical protein